MFYYDGRDMNLKEAVDQANAVMRDPVFLGNLRNVEDFDMTELSSKKVVECLLLVYNHGQNIEVQTYKPWWKWSKAYAMFDLRKPFKINLSSRKLNRSVASIVGSIIHEFVHLADNQYYQFDFGHGNNNPTGKESTAPYLAGRMAKQYKINSCY